MENALANGTECLANFTQQTGDTSNLCVSLVKMRLPLSMSLRCDSFASSSLSPGLFLSSHCVMLMVMLMEMLIRTHSSVTGKKSFFLLLLLPCLLFFLFFSSSSRDYQLERWKSCVEKTTKLFIF